MAFESAAAGVRSQRSSAKAYALIHAAVFAWGFTSILGRAISLDAAALVWWRLLLSVLALGAVPRVWRGLAAVEPWRAAGYVGVGGLLGLHFLAFYGSVKWADASVAAICLALTPVMVALIGPTVCGQRPAAGEVLVGLAAVLGVALVVGGAPARMKAGLIAGVAAAAILALVAVLNKRILAATDVLTVTWLQLAGGLALLTFLGLVPTGVTSYTRAPAPRDMILLTILALPCTVLPSAMYFAALRHLSAFRTQLVVTLEPVYAILLAVVFLGEQRELGVRFYVGATVVIACLVAHDLVAAPGSGT